MTDSRIFQILIILYVSFSSLFAEEKRTEAYYRDLFAKTHKGETEVVIGDKSRYDVVTETHAIEVERASK